MWSVSIFLALNFICSLGKCYVNRVGKRQKGQEKAVMGERFPTHPEGLQELSGPESAQQLFHVNIFDWGHRNLDFMLKIEHWFRRLPDKRLKWNSKLGCHKRRWRILNIYFGGDFFLPFVSWSHYLQCGHVGSEPVLWWLCGDRSLFMWWWLITWCACHLL